MYLYIVVIDRFLLATDHDPGAVCYCRKIIGPGCVPPFVLARQNEKIDPIAALVVYDDVDHHYCYECVDFHSTR